MAKYLTLALAIIILVFSQSSSSVIDKETDPSLEIIKHEDAEEGYHLSEDDQQLKAKGARKGRFLESLVCNDPKTPDNTVKTVDGNPPHMSSKVNVTCNPGMHFVGHTVDYTSVEVMCQPLPHPCMCMAAWTTLDNFQLMYEFNCTKDQQLKSKGARKGRFLESLVCNDPQSHDNTVKTTDGNPPHLYSKVNVTCNPGMHFVGHPVDYTSIEVTCLPLPHPCMCMAAWETLDDYLLMYDFNCTKDLQCPDPKPINATLKVLSGKPYGYQCNVLLTCFPGLVFPDGQHVRNITCEPLPVMPPQVIWNPQISVPAACKDLQCPDPKPINATLKVLSGKPYTDGCVILLTCFPGLIFPDGQHVWNSTCTPAAVIPPKLFWIPQFDGQPTCSEPKTLLRNEKHGGEDMEVEVVPLSNINLDVDDSEPSPILASENSKHPSPNDLQCPDQKPINATLKVLYGQPYELGCNVLLTCFPGLVFPDGQHVWNITCEPIPVSPLQVIWNPQITVPAACKELQCPDPKPINATLKVLSGKPYTDGCVILLTCFPGLVFPDGQHVWNSTCRPAPVVPPTLFWIPQFDGQPTCSEPKTLLQNEEHGRENMEVEVVPLSNINLDEEDSEPSPVLASESSEQPSPNDDLQCPNPKPINATLKVLYGQPYELGCNVLLTCFPGLVFPDGQHVWNITCEPIPVSHLQVIWNPQISLPPTCKELQCRDPKPINGTLTVVSGKPYDNGCKVVLTCFPGLVFPDSKSVWNITCVPVSVLPKQLTWIPQYTGHPTCSEPKDIYSENNGEAEHEEAEHEENKGSTDDELPSFAPEEDLNGIQYIIESNEPNEIMVNLDKTSDQSQINVENIEELTNQIYEYKSTEPEEYQSSETEDEEETTMNEDVTEYSDSLSENQAFESENTVNNIDNEKPQPEENDDIENEIELTNNKELSFDNMFSVETEDDGEFGETSEIKTVETDYDLDENIELTDANANIYIKQEEFPTEEGDFEEIETEIPENDEQLFNIRYMEFENDIHINEPDEQLTNDELPENEEETDEGLAETEYDANVSHFVEEEEEEPEEVMDDVMEVSEQEQEDGYEEDEEVHEQEEQTGGDDYIERNDVQNERQPGKPLENSRLTKDTNRLYVAITGFGNQNFEEEQSAEEEATSVVQEVEEADSPESFLDIQEGPVTSDDNWIEVPDEQAMCQLPAKTGFCKAYLRRYFYNKDTNECELFIYGGCGGNENNFDSLKECFNKCGSFESL